MQRPGPRTPSDHNVLLGSGEPMREALSWVQRQPCAPPIAVVLCFACCLGQARADITVVSPRGMTLDEAVQFALENHPALATAEQGVRVEETGLQQAWAMDDLTVDASAQFTALGPVTSISMPNPQTGETERYEIGSPFTRNLSIAATKPLNLGSRVDAQEKAAEASIAAAERQVENARRSVALGVKQAFYNVLRAEHLRLVAIDAVERSDAHLRITEAKLSEGTVAAFDVDRATAEAASARARLRQAEGAVRSALAILSRALGLDPADRVQINAPLVPEFIWVGEARARDVAHRRPDVQVLEHQMDVLAQQIRFQEKQDHAIVSAFGTTGYKVGSGFTDGFNWTLGIAATWPLANGGSDEALIAKYQAQRTQLELSIADKLQQIDTEIRTALEGLSTARSSVEDAAQSVISTQTAYTRILLAYENDVAAWIDLRDAESALIAAEQTFVTTLFAYQLARADLEYAVGADALDELIVPGVLAPPTLPDMPGLRTPEQAPPIPDLPGVEGQLIEPMPRGQESTASEGQEASAPDELPSAEENGGSDQ